MQLCKGDAQKRVQLTELFSYAQKVLQKPTLFDLH